MKGFLKLEDLQIVMIVVATESPVSWPVSEKECNVATEAAVVL